MAFRGGFCISVVSINHRKIDDIDIQNYSIISKLHIFYFTLIVTQIIIFQWFCGMSISAANDYSQFNWTETMTKERNFFQILLLTVHNLI